MAEARYKEGQAVMLGAWEDQPQQPAVVVSAEVLDWGICYVVEVDPESWDDDGLRELTEDQILGPIGNGVVLH